MSNMNGNPHAEDAARYVNEASSLHEWPNSERPIIAANAQALATLALAYEQRTANLIAKLALNVQVATGGVGLNSVAESIDDEIMARLGLKDEVTA